MPAVPRPLRRVSLLLALALTLTACSKAEDAKPNPDFVPRREVATTTTPATLPSGEPDPYAVPEVIDKAYIEKVLNGLEAERVKVRENVYLRDRYDPEDDRRLRAVFMGDALDWNITYWPDNVHVEHPEKDGRTTLAASLISVSTIRSAGRGCIWAEALTTPQPGLPDYPPYPTGNVLRREKDVDRSLNPTGWKLAQNTSPEFVTKEMACD